MNEPTNEPDDLLEDERMDAFFAVLVTPQRELLFPMADHERNDR